MRRLSRVSSTSSSAASPRHSSSTASRSSTAQPVPPTSARWSTRCLPSSTCDNDALALAGIALLIVGLGFKVAAAPFHVWVPDVYQGAPSPVTAFMASAGKVAAFGAIIRVLVIAPAVLPRRLAPIIWVLALLSLVVGSFLAVVQTNVKRMLAYSSVSHAGFLLVGVEAAAHTPARPTRGRASRRCCCT